MTKPIFNSVVDTKQEARLQVVKTSASALVINLAIVGLLAWYFDPAHVLFIMAISGLAQLVTSVLVTALHVRQSLSGAEKRARIRHLSDHDELSGLRNRRKFMLDVQVACRNDAPKFFMIADLDRFKSVNDTYGHVVGDTVIQAVGGVLSGYNAGRLGGEEFAILMETASLEEARAQGEALLAEIAALEIPAGTGRANIRVTMSAGIAPLDCELGIQETYQLADTALYTAKVFGRNRVICAGEIPEIPGSQTLEDAPETRRKA